MRVSLKKYYLGMHHYYIIHKGYHNEAAIRDTHKGGRCGDGGPIQCGEINASELDRWNKGRHHYAETADNPHAYPWHSYP
jgi:hypothetical protein